MTRLPHASAFRTEFRFCNGDTKIAEIEDAARGHSPDILHRNS